MYHNPQKLDVKGPLYFWFAESNGGNYLLNKGSQVTVCRIIQKKRSKWQLLDHERLKLNLCPVVQVPGQLRTLQPNVYSQLRQKFHNILSPLPVLMKTRNPVNRKRAKTHTHSNNLSTATMLGKHSRTLCHLITKNAIQFKHIRNTQFL